MERSTEVEAFTRDFYALMQKGDGAGAAALLTDDTALFIGTDGDEWWDTPEAGKKAFKEQLEATGGFDIHANDPVGHAIGDVGWVADRPTMRIGDQDMPMRMTCVLRRVDGSWRVAQGHLSVAADINNDLFA